LLIKGEPVMEEKLGSKTYYPFHLCTPKKEKSRRAGFLKISSLTEDLDSNRWMGVGGRSDQRKTKAFL